MGCADESADRFTHAVPVTGGSRQPEMEEPSVRSPRALRSSLGCRRHCSAKRARGKAFVGEALWHMIGASGRDQRGRAKSSYLAFRGSLGIGACRTAFSVRVVSIFRTA